MRFRVEPWLQGFTVRACRIRKDNVSASSEQSLLALQGGNTDDCKQRCRAWWQGHGVRQLPAGLLLAQILQRLQGQAHRLSGSLHELY